MSDKSMETTAQKALKAVAKREGVSVERVRREMEIAINAARESDDPDVRALWEKIPMKNNGFITADDVIAYFVQMHNKDNY